MTHMPRLNLRRRTSARRKPLVHPLAGAVVLVLAATAAQAQTLPTQAPGGAVVRGVATVTTNGSTMQIDQTSNRAVLHWNDFSIGTGATVHFEQPTNGIALNRVLGANPSEIWGTLTATGRVFLVNPNGVLFAPGSRVEVGGLVASVIDTDTDAFMNEGSNSFRFFSVDGELADISNYGTLIANPGGTIALLGNSVRNEVGIVQGRLGEGQGQGAITADSGSILLAATDGVTLDFFGDRLTQVSFMVGTDDGIVVNRGRLQADGGSVELRTDGIEGQLGDFARIYNTGTIQANTLQNVAGRIVLDAGVGEVHVGSRDEGYSAGGRIEATGLNAGETGGEIEIRGGAGVYIVGERYMDADVGLVNRPVTIDASGAAGGGTISIHSRSLVNILGDNQLGDGVPSVLIRADAIESGEAGSITIASDGEQYDDYIAAGLRIFGPAMFSAQGLGAATAGSVAITSGSFLELDTLTVVGGSIDVSAVGRLDITDSVFVADDDDGAITVSGDRGVSINGSSLDAAGSIAVTGETYGVYMDETSVHAAGNVAITGHFDVDDDSTPWGVELWDSAITSDGGTITITGTSTANVFEVVGVGIIRTTVASAGGGVEIRGFGGNDYEYLQQAIGVFIAAGSQIGSADTASVRIVGEATGVAGTRAGVSLGSETMEMNCGSGETCTLAADRIVLQAAIDGGGAGSAPILVESGAVDIIAGQVVNLRPGGVNADGSVREITGQAISLLGTGGFAIGQGILDAIDAPNLVIGSDLHTGLITLDDDLVYDGNLTLQSGGTGAAGILLNGSIGVGANTLALVSDGDIRKPFENDLISAESLLAISTSGDVYLPYSDVGGPTLAGSAAGDFLYVDVDEVTIGTVDALGFSAGGNQAQALTATGVTAGGDVFIQNLSGNLTLLAGVTAGGDLTLVTAGTLQNIGGAALAAGGQWRVWASTWVGETRGGLAGSGTLPNLYNCTFAGACGVTLSGTENQFIYAAQPTAVVTIGSQAREYGLENGPLDFDVAGLILGDLAGNAIAGTPSTMATILSGVGNYTIDGVFTSPAGYAIQYAPGILAITPATLFYVANPYARLFGLGNGILTGTVTGFRNGETLETATTGTLLFTSPADRESLPGFHAIDGSGLSARNYVFVQAPTNATALRVDGLPSFVPPTRFGPPDDWPVDPNFGPEAVCPVVAATMFASQTREEDSLALEWSRVRATPNVTNCLQSEHGRGCDDF